MTPDKTFPQSKRIVRMRTLDDIAACFDWSMAQGKNAKAKSGRSVTLHSKNSGSWSGTKTAAEFRELLARGWQAGVDGVEGLEGLATDSAERIQFVRSPGGAFPVVPAHLAGHPASMLRPVAQDVTSERGLTLVLDMGYNSGVDSKTVIHYARTVMRLVAWLTAEQIQIAVYGDVSVSLEGAAVEYIFAIQPSGRILQPERLAMAMHPATFRRGYFALAEYEYCELDYKDQAVAGGTYGVALKPDLTVLKHAIPEAYAVVALPKPGDGDPERAIREAYNLRFKHKD